MTTGKSPVESKPYPDEARMITPDGVPVRSWVEDNLDRVYAYTFRLTGDHDLAEELTQQTFLIAQERLGQLRHPDRLPGWLLRIARNYFLKTVRKRTPLAASQVDLQVDQIAAPYDSVAWDDERLAMALDGLPDGFRTVVLMYYFEELSYQQIANELQMPIGTVMSRLSRARRALREAITRMESASDSLSVSSV